MTLFRRCLHTYICLDIYAESVEVEAIGMQFSPQVLVMTFFIHFWNHWMHFIGHSNGIQYSKTSVHWHYRCMGRCSVTMHWNGGLVEAWNLHMRHVFPDVQDVQEGYGQNKTRHNKTVCILYLLSFYCAYYFIDAEWRTYVSLDQIRIG